MLEGSQTGEQEEPRASADEGAAGQVSGGRNGKPEKDR